MPDRWRLVRRALVRDFSVTRVYDAVYADPRNGTEHDRVILDTPEWVNVVALTPDRQLIMVRQFRAGIEALTLELPGGIVDADEDPARCAARELEEETGYAPGELRSLGTVHPDPASRTNRVHLFLALGCTRIHDGRQDTGEDIEVVLEPYDALRGMADRGEITHVITLAALHLAEPVLAPVAAG